jgi:hypothetical protein
MPLLDADGDGADWREVARIVLRIDPEREPDRARRTFESQLARARWAARKGSGICFGAIGLAQLKRSADKTRWRSCIQFAVQSWKTSAASRASACALLHKPGTTRLSSIG